MIILSASELAEIKLRADAGEIVQLPSRSVAEEYRELFQSGVGYVKAADGSFSYYAGSSDEDVLRVQMKSIYYRLPVESQIPFRSGYGAREVGDAMP